MQSSTSGPTQSSTSSSRIGRRGVPIVLVVTHSRDDHAPAVLTELASRGVEAVRFDTDFDLGRCKAELQVGGGAIQARLFAEGEWLACEEVSSVLYLHLQLPDGADVEDPQARLMARSERRATLEGALLAIDGYWLNHPHANRLARHKPLQLAHATRLGMAVPQTLISDDPAAIRSSYRRWDGQMIAKLSGGQIAAEDATEQYAVYTTALSAEDLQDDAPLAVCPAIYQRKVNKAFDLRVTVVGEHVFGCKIESQAREDTLVDWRRAGVKGLALSQHPVDHETARGCIALMSSFGLGFAAFDFAVTPEGEPVFLELNATGRWLWVQEATGMPIAAAIAERLLRAEAGLAHG